MKNRHEWLVRRPFLFGAALFFGIMALSEFWRLILFRGHPRSWEDALSAGFGGMVGGLACEYWIGPKIRRRGR